MAVKQPKPIPPYLPFEPTKADVLAWLALSAGSANADQQKRVLNMLVHKLCETYGLSYRPGDSDGTAFAEGKRFVGLQVVKLLNTNPDKIKE